MLGTIHLRKAIILCLITLLAIAPVIWARAMDSQQREFEGLDGQLSRLPNRQCATHDAGNMELTMTNTGLIGPMPAAFSVCAPDAPTCVYPKGSDFNFLFVGTYWVGAVVGSDTLVSVGTDSWFGGINELLPDEGSIADIITLSKNPADPAYSPEAIADQEYIAVFTDTLIDLALNGVNPADARSHIPIKFEIVQHSYAWDDPGFDEFVLVESHLKNLSAAPLTDVWVGIYIDADIYHAENDATGFFDDITGYIPTENMAYVFDNDGDPSGAWDYRSARAAFGLKVHGAGTNFDRINYNWWMSNGDPSLDFGPRLAGTPEDPFFPFGPHLGTPTSDVNKYYMLSHPEIDYDQHYTAMSHESIGFLPPPAPAYAIDIADGRDTRFLISFGPFNLAPGEVVPFYYSVVMGNNIHVNPNDFAEYFDPAEPYVFDGLLDFSNLTAAGDAAEVKYGELTAGPVCADSDGDGFGDPWAADNECPPDNCPFVPNPDQADDDLDGIGDACDDGAPARVMVPYDMIRLRWARAIFPIEMILYLGDFANGYEPTDIDPMTLNLNGTQTPTSAEFLPVCPGFTKGAWDLRFDMRQFVGEYPPWLWIETKDLLLSGMLINGGMFNIPAEFIGYGYVFADATGDDYVNIGDAVFMINHVFKSGPEPVLPELGDSNSDGCVNVGDIVYLVNYVFNSGPAPKAPPAQH